MLYRFETTALAILLALALAPGRADAVDPPIERLTEQPSEELSVSGSGLASISDDGSTVAFVTNAESRVENMEQTQEQSPAWRVYVQDVDNGDVTLASRAEDGTPSNGRCTRSDLSADGSRVVFACNSTNLVEGESTDEWRIYLRDLESDELQLVSPTGDPTWNGGPQITPDGRYVVFQTASVEDARRSHRSQIYMRNLKTGELTLVSKSAAGEAGHGWSGMPFVSADARYVAFRSSADNLTGSPTDRGGVFVKDLQTGEVRRASVTEDGEPLHGSEVTMSGDGRDVGFYATNGELLGGTDETVWTVAVKDMKTGELTVASQTSDGVVADGASHSPALTPDGRHVAFRSDATNLLDDVDARRARVYLKDLETGELELISPRVDLPDEPPPNSVSNGVVHTAIDVSTEAEALVFDTNAPLDGERGSQRRSHVYIWRQPAR